MKELLEFLIKGILGTSDFTIEEETDQDRVVFKINPPSDKIGLLVGKGGKTISAIQNVVSVRARLENKNVYITVS